MLSTEPGADLTLCRSFTFGGASWSRGKRHPTPGDGVLVGAGARFPGPVEIGARAGEAAGSPCADIPGGN